jgi:hypothetical protein
MPNERPEPVVRAEALPDVLLGYLRDAGCPFWPGTDGLTVKEALGSYLQNAAVGRVPDLQELLRRHADLRDSLLAFFAGEDPPSQRHEC